MEDIFKKLDDCNFDNMIKQAKLKKQTNKHLINIIMILLEKIDELEIELEEAQALADDFQESYINIAEVLKKMKKGEL